MCFQLNEMMYFKVDNLCNYYTGSHFSNIVSLQNFYR